MFDAYIEKVNLTSLMLVLSVVFVLPVQYWLCCKVRPLLARLLPALLFALGAAVCVLLAYGAQDWDGLFYVLFALYCGFLLAASALGWALWAGLRFWRKRKASI